MLALACACLRAALALFDLGLSFGLPSLNKFSLLDSYFEPEGESIRARGGFAKVMEDKGLRGR
jgi:hypothetical protein